MAKIKIHRDYSAILDSMNYIIAESERSGLTDISQLLQVVMDIVRGNVTYDPATEAEMYVLINSVYEQTQDKNNDVATVILECVKNYNSRVRKVLS